jgi:hypothetical protein
MCLIPTYNIIFHAWASKFFSMHPHVTNSTEQSPSCQTRRSSASQEIPHIFWNPKVHYRIHNGSPPITIPSQVNPFHTSPSHISKIHFQILTSHLHLELPRNLFHSGFPTQTLYEPLLSPTRATSTTHLVLLDLITRVIFGEE